MGKRRVEEKNVKSLVTEESVPDTVSDGNMLASYEVFSVKNSDGKGSAELNKEKYNAKEQDTKSRC